MNVEAGEIAVKGGLVAIGESDWMVSAHLNWPNCLNARDLGGMPTADGTTIRTGALIRTDGHEHLTEAGVAAVHAYGVGRIIDLRREQECAKWVSPFTYTPLYLNIPVQNPADPDEDNGFFDLAAIYRRMLDRRPDLFATAVAAIAEAPAGGVVVHCAGGKDRTGMVVALALTIADVDPAVIATDYAVTEERLRERSVAYLAGIEDPIRKDQLRQLQTTAPETMLDVLSHLQTNYGSVSAFLETGGCDAERQALLRKRLRVEA